MKLGVRIEGNEWMTPLICADWNGDYFVPSMPTSRRYAGRGCEMDGMTSKSMTLEFDDYFVCRGSPVADPQVDRQTGPLSTS